MAPEGGEDLEGPALLIGDGVRLVQQRGVGAPHLEARAGQLRLQPGVARDHRRLVPPVPEDRPRAGAGRQLPEDLPGVTPETQQPGTPGAQGLVERSERVMQPPARGAPGGPRAFAGVVENVDGQHGATPLKGRVQGGIILQAQVLAEPEDRG